MADQDAHYNGTNEINNARTNQPIPGIPGVPPTLPSLPGQNVPGQFYGQVRFLNASTYNMPVNIMIDDTVYSPNSVFSTVSEYGWVADGFHTVTVRQATGPRTLLYQQTLPFTANQMTTMVLNDSMTSGMDITAVSDTGCMNLPFNVSCFRFANMAYSGSNFDLLLDNGDTVFNNVDFKTVASYKQAIAGTYHFRVVNSNLYPTPRALPIIIIGNISMPSSMRQPLVSFDADLAAGQNVSAYVIGNTWSDQYPLQVVVTLDGVKSNLQPFVTTP